MRKVINPWEGQGLFHCFGCDKDNKHGLQMQFFEEGDELLCTWEPQNYYQGYIDTLHGGIQATLHDEIASWIVYVKGQTAGLTTNLNVDYKKGVLVTEGPIKLSGLIVEKDRRFIKMSTSLYNHKGELCSKASVTYRVYSQQVAIEKLHYPGPEAFFEKLT